MENLIEIRSAGMRYERGGRPFWALRNASLSVAAGDFVTVLGRSGSGKSTLLNIIVGLLTPTEGEVFLAGKNLAGLTDAARSELRNAAVGYVPQSAGLIPTLTVLENVRLPWYIAGTRGAEPEGRAAELLAKVGLADLADQYPGALSGGELRRVAIARALMCSPAVVVADEPTSNLDPASAQTVVELFRGIALDGGAVLMVTHDTFSLDASTRIFDMAGGTLTARPAASIETKDSGQGL
ncbi:ABC transporter ATP-binding protein [Sutterella sp.]|uniref:ABC transporter ATP-binding protein n=1 Tax=Sutterella sp. TaxID=1981025 RepID=UPI0026DFC22E|nr:ABC transporter ATP-binding protein [Sutterella sp.]MDO5531374.1 ABC transporter ATP-binding protein [Sutterella sp.]